MTPRGALAIVVLLLCVVIGLGAWAAGGVTHCEMGRRAWDDHLVPDRDLLPGLAELRADDDAMRAFYCGCVFPDFGYDGISGDAAEYAHWYPYQEAYFEFIKERFPPPWSKEALRHVAFFFGALCHNVGDTPWHFDEGPDKSLITAAIEREHNDNADVIAEIFSVVLFDQKPRVAGHYWWATDDALAVFQRRGVAVTLDQIERGCRKLEAERRKGGMFGPLAYPALQARYPWTRRHFEDYYYGGVDCGAALTAMCIGYEYARLQGWHVYQNIPLKKIVFPDEKPYLPCIDTTLSVGRAGSWRGAEPVLEVGGGPDGEQCVFIRFDLGPLASSDVHEAKLWLALAGRRDSGQAFDVGIDVYRVEDNGPKPAMEGARPVSISLLTEMWQRATTSRDPAVHPAASTTVRADEQAGWKAFDVTACVRGWAEKPGTNCGLMLKALKPDTPAAIQFYSSDALMAQPDGYGGTHVALRPMLVVR